MSSIYIAILLHIYIYTTNTSIIVKSCSKKHKASIYSFLYTKGGLVSLLIIALRRCVAGFRSAIFGSPSATFFCARALGIGDFLCVCCGFSCILRTRKMKVWKKVSTAPHQKHYCCYFLWRVVFGWFYHTRKDFLKVAMPQDLQCHNSELVS